MAILEDTPTMYKCPKCNATGPYNFRLEQRVSLKRADPKFPEVLNVLGIQSVYACINCGHVVMELQ